MELCVWPPDESNQNQNYELEHTEMILRVEGSWIVGW